MLFAVTFTIEEAGGRVGSNPREVGSRITNCGASGAPVRGDQLVGLALGVNTALCVTATPVRILPAVVSTSISRGTRTALHWAVIRQFC